MYQNEFTNDNALLPIEKIIQIQNLLKDNVHQKQLSNHKYA